ncbi:unnamed protein product [Discula destructiva]
MLGSTTILVAFAALATAAPMANQTIHTEPRAMTNHTLRAEPRGLLSGQLTWYTEGMGVLPTACGAVHQVTEVSFFPSVNRPIHACLFCRPLHANTSLRQHIAALSPADYGVYANPNNSPVCGKQIRVHGSNGHSVVATVADRCAGCTGHNVDVTPGVFVALGFSEGAGRVDISWEYL